MTENKIRQVHALAWIVRPLFGQRHLPVAQFRNKDSKTKDSRLFHILTSTSASDSMPRSRNGLTFIKLKSQQDKTGNRKKMDISIQRICHGEGFTAFFDEAVIEKCYYVNSQEERVEIIHRLESIIIQCGLFGYNTIHISGYDPLCNCNVPLIRFKVPNFNYSKQLSAEIATAVNNIQEVLPVSLGILIDSKVNYFSILKDGEKLQSYLILNPPNCDDYYFRIIFKEKK